MADNSKAKTSRIDPAEIAEIMENDLTAVGRHRTEVSTETVVEDRTEAPALVPVVAFKEVETVLESGTILTSYDSVDAE